MQVSGGREGLEDACNFEIELVIHADDLIDRIRIAEISAGDCRGQHHGKRISQGCSWVAFQYIHVEHRVKAAVGKKEVVFIENLVLIAHRHIAGRQQTGDLLNIGKIIFQQRAEGWGDGTEMEGDDALVVVKAAGDAVDPVCLPVIFIITGLMQDISEDQQAAGKADGQSKEVNEGNELILSQVAYRNPEVIFKHKESFRSLLTNWENDTARQ